MTTLVIVKKAGQVAIAAETLVTFGDTRLGSRFEANSKILRLDTPQGVNYVGMAGSVAHFPVLRKAMGSLPPEQVLLGSKDEIFDTFTRLHPVLKDQFYLQTKDCPLYTSDASDHPTRVVNGCRRFRDQIN